ncbi:hypothetical protein ABFG93_08045 [Pseudalkalibacillus hwajinpoensis]|uniref:hypothetical protein n=1 Tax=Guptibacillus hwajinpoensis TaxID=208199 RepID=UPI00325B8125
MAIKNVQKEKLAVDRCMKHLDVVNVEPKVKQLVSMYMTSLYRQAYEEGFADSEKEKLKSEQNFL